MIQFFRDLTCIPAMWRRAVKEERDLRLFNSPEEKARREHQMIATAMLTWPTSERPYRLLQMMAKAPSGQFDQLLSGLNPHPGTTSTP